MELECYSLEFLSEKDENNFFNWLNSLDCVNDIYGKGLSVFIDIKEDINDESLKEIIAAFYRYEIDMTQLAVFKNANNQDWFFGNRSAYWNKKVFPANTAE
ncbi:hypothetical protein [Psychromonas sp. MME1]|uniref:hypothetical protein n=1 Tax=Psychromonas sp. MME1 TaxID=3231032 RepID=UPI0034E1EA64